MPDLAALTALQQLSLYKRTTGQCRSRCADRMGYLGLYNNALTGTVPATALTALRTAWTTTLTGTVPGLDADHAAAAA